MNNKLGEFEEIVLLLVAAQHEEAYGLSITKAIEAELNRSVTMSSVHNRTLSLGRERICHLPYRRCRWQAQRQEKKGFCDHGSG